MKKIYFLLLMLILSNCKSVQKTSQSIEKISKEKFLEKPFGFKETIKDFSNNSVVKFKTEKLLNRNRHYPEKTDTIYKFYYKKSEVFFYKTHTGKEFLLAGKIMNKQIELVNQIFVGIPKTDFKNRFSENLEIKGDSIQMLGTGTKYTFIFKKDKLYRINIDNYFD